VLHRECIKRRVMSDLHAMNNRCNVLLARIISIRLDFETAWLVDGASRCKFWLLPIIEFSPSCSLAISTLPETTSS
jgi:hypothetical protein